MYVLSQGAQCGAGQSRWDAEVSLEEAADCLSHRWIAAEGRSQTRRPAADGRGFPPHCGKGPTDIILRLGYTDEAETFYNPAS